MDRSTAIVRGTNSANFYEIPIISPTGSAISSQPSFASTWGPSTTTTMSMSSSSSKHRVTNPNANVDLNASFHGKSPFGLQSGSRSGGGSRGRGTVNADEPLFQPAFAFDVNDLVSNLRRSASTTSLSSSLSSSAAMGNSSLKRSESNISWQSASIPHSSSQQNLTQYSEQLLRPSGDSSSSGRIQVVPVEPVMTRRGRRDALSGGEHSRSQVVHDNLNSIITYNMNRRKKKPIVGMPTSASSPNTYPPPYSPLPPHSAASTTAAAAAAGASASRSVPLQQAFSSRRSNTPSPPPDFSRPTTTITTPNGIEYTTDVTTRTTRVTSFYEESFTF